jgi:hypothetical protein
MSDIRYRIKVYSDIRYNVGLHSLQSDIGSSDIKLSLISLITDIGVPTYGKPPAPAIVNLFGNLPPVFSSVLH